MDKILAFGAIPFPELANMDLHSHRGIVEVRRQVGGNTGNCIIGEYGRLGINGIFTNKHFPNRYDGLSPEEANDKFDHVVIFAANWISREFNGDFSPDVEWFSRLKIPVTVIGLGQQLPNTCTSKEQLTDFIASLHPTFVRFFQLLAEKNTAIAVRGYRTQEIMSAMGINNVNPTGCPTWYVNGTDQRPIVKTKPYSSDLKLVFHASPSHSRQTYRRLFELAANHPDASLMLQSEFYLAPYTGPCASDANFLVRGKYSFDRSMTARPNWARICVSLEAWESYLRTRDFSFGMRIHGTILALKNHIPAIILTHDSRTSEFVEILGIPSRNFKDLLNESFSLQQLYDETDFTLMNTRYPVLLENYRDFLVKNGLTHKNRSCSSIKNEGTPDATDPHTHKDYWHALCITSRLSLERYWQKIQGKGVLSHAPIKKNAQTLSDS